ncbi:MAG: fasciclin domain-containing protein [Flavobacteriales bacterium]|jgi:uncharacterized surface protein with fasciclin (FAS1) repeats|nr:fasciclin domain-containing protein [Flavobacteriales bacterium]
MLKTIYNSLIIAIIITLLFSCSQENDSIDNQITQEISENIHNGQASIEAVEGEQLNALQVAMSIPEFSTLVSAIETAGVEDAVVNTGPLTIFAPLNTAFEDLPEGTLENLVRIQNRATLINILINHVAPSNYPEKQLRKEAKKGRKLYMASGEYLIIEEIDDEIFIGGSKILKSVDVSNGWIHVIDDVLIP